MTLAIQIRLDHGETSVYVKHPDRVVVGSGEIRFVTWDHPLWDWKVRGVHGAETPIFVDHAVYYEWF